MKIYLLVVCVLLTTFATACNQRAPWSSGNALENLTTVRDLDQALNNAQYDHVIKHAQIYLDEYPESDQVWILLGWAYAKTDNVDKSKECFDKALAINKSNDNAYVGLGVVYRKLGDNDKARESYAEALRLLPKNPEALSSLLVIELLEGQHDQAVDYGERAWKMRKNLASIPANLAIAYHYTKNTAKRDYYYQKARELDYHDMSALDDIIAGRTFIGEDPDEDTESD
jgi:tetratricopeptide (TPR) repeat protein